MGVLTIRILLFKEFKVLSLDPLFSETPIGGLYNCFIGFKRLRGRNDWARVFLPCDGM